MARIVVSAALVAATLLIALAACRPPPETPPGPSRPTNPMNAHAVALDPGDGVIDASIVSDAGRSLEAAVVDLDTGALRHQP
jgi:hypothetical protein